MSGAQLFMACLLVAHIVSVYVFMVGFMLTRIELPRRSECDASPTAYDAVREFAAVHDLSGDYSRRLERWHAAGSPSVVPEWDGNGCWMQRRFRKAVLVVVDALRFDFAHYDQDLDHDEHLNFRNRLKLFERISSTSPEHGRLYVFEADPPTTTMQRLKALVTGGMPTFIDFSSNFDSNAIREDNIVHQFRKSGLHLVMMGDDTWINLFPNTFHKAYPYPSFNVKDLHTVDDGVIAHLRPEVDAGAFDLLIAHFLGVDHIGHRFYANHPTMKDKLTQLDGVLDDLVGALDNDTILFVFGDHGMTSDGNHGGTTAKEANAALFVYSKRAIFPRSTGLRHPIHPSIKQVDLVPTVSLLMGTPIPYANLGMVISDMFGLNGDLAQRVHALRTNAWQVQRYLHEYSTESDVFETESMQHLTSEFLAVDGQYLDATLEDAGRRNVVLEDIVSRYEKVLLRSGELCREKWTVFNLEFMAHGLFLTILTALAATCYVGFEPVLSAPGMAKSVLASVVMLSPITHIVVGLSALSSIASSACIGALLRVIYDAFVSARRDFVFPSIPVAGTLFIIGCYMEGLFTSSLISQDGLAVRYFAVSMALLLGLFDLRLPGVDGFISVLSALAIAILLRIMGEGESFGPGALLSDEFFSPSQLFQTYAGLVVLAAFMVAQISKLNQPVMRVLLTVWLASILVVIGVYWYKDVSTTLDSHASFHYLPNYVYVTSAFVALSVTSSSKFGVKTNRDTSISLLLGALTGPLLLVQGARSPSVYAAAYSIIGLLEARRKRIGSRGWTGIPETTFMWFLSVRVYFATGHTNAFGSLQVSAAFVGFETFEFYRSGALLALNTFGMYLVCIIGLALLCPDLDEASSPRLHKRDSRHLGYAFERPAICMMFLNAVRAGLSTLNTLIQRRHLMVWDIFAPKLVFDTVAMVLVDVLVVAVVRAARRL
ncbi:GPI ethanolamine phosphate transferase 3 [Plasmodiophora brassicae]